MAPLPDITLEVCIDTIEGAIVATDCGVLRIEVCSALSVGGLTPSAGLMQACRRLRVQNYAMIRPRVGGFVYTSADIDLMCADIAVAKDCGMDGVVFGAVKTDNTLDLPALRTLINAAGSMGITLHRAFDLTPDPMAALEQAIALGFERILTSGHKKTALDGVDLLSDLVIRANGRISIMPGSGVQSENVAAIIARTGAKEVHSSCSRKSHPPQDALGFEDAHGRNQTDTMTIGAIQTSIGECA